MHAKTVMKPIGKIPIWDICPATGNVSQSSRVAVFVRHRPRTARASEHRLTAHLQEARPRCPQVSHRVPARRGGGSPVLNLSTDPGLLSEKAPRSLKTESYPESTSPQGSVRKTWGPVHPRMNDPVTAARRLRVQREVVGEAAASAADLEPSVRPSTGKAARERTG